MLYRSYRYSHWDGTQQIFDIDADELMDRLSDETLRQGDVMRALQRDCCGRAFRTGTASR